MCDTNSHATATRGVPFDNGRLRAGHPLVFARKRVNTRWHRHEHDYMAVSQLDDTLESDLPGDQHMTARFEPGVTYFRETDAEHDAINSGDFPCAFIKIELLDKRG